VVEEWGAVHTTTVELEGFKELRIKEPIPKIRAVNSKKSIVHADIIHNTESKTME